MSINGRARAVVVGGGVVVVAVAAQLVRQPGARTWNTVWAEDGTVYASEAYTHSAISTLFRGYAGYAQFLPRFIALGVRPLPVSWVAPYFAVATALVIVLLAMFVHRCLHGWIQSAWLRASVTAMTVLAPILFFEINANIANLGWPLLFASFWAFASRRQGAVDTVLRGIVVALTALTTPLVALLLPAAVVVALVRRRRADSIVLVTCVVALGAQWLAVRAANPGPSGPSSFRDLPVEYGVRVVGSLVFGERWLDGLWVHLGVMLVVLAVLVVLAAIVLAAPQRIGADRRWFATGTVLLSAILFFVPVWLRGTADMRVIGDVVTDAGSRYVYVPLLVLLSGLIVLIDGSERRWLVGIATAQVAVLMFACFGLANLRSAGPTWSSQLSVARATCQQKDAPPAVKIPITPDGLGWFMTVPCGRLGHE